MKKLAILSVMGLALIMGTIGCSQDQQNAIKKMRNSFVAGDYKVTVLGPHPFEYMVKDDKITSVKKGYYLFYIDGKMIQTPIQLSIVEEQ